MVTVKASKSTLLILTACLISLTVLILDSLNLPTFIDEISFLLNVKYFAQYGTFIPFYTKYPTLYSYIIAVPVYFVFLVFYFVKGLPLNGLGDTAFLRFVFYENLIMWNWVSRCITMLFSVATLTMVLKRAIKKYGPMAFFTTAAILVLDPFGVYMDLSRFGLPDIPMTFFVTAAMFLCLSYLDGKNLKYLYWASFVSGLAASTKFNAVMMIFPLFVAPLIIGKEKRRLPLCYVRIIFLVILGFLAGSPAFLFSFRTLLDGFIFEAKILFEEGHLGAHGIIWIWALDLLWEMNPVVLFLMISSIFYSALKRTKEDLLFLSLFVPSFLILGALEKKSIWYFVFLYPLAALYAGRFIEDIFRMMKLRYLRITVVCFVFIFIFAVPGWDLYGRLSKNTRVDNRIISEKWIYNNIPAGASVAIDWAYIPELYSEKQIDERVKKVVDSGSSFTGEIESRYRKKPTYKTIRLRHDLNYDLDAFLRAGTEYMLTSSYCYDRFFPSKETRIPGKHDASYEMFIKRRDFYSAVFDKRTPYRLIKVFSSGSGPEVRIYKRVRSVGHD